MALLNDEGPSSFGDWVGYDSKLLFLSEQESTSIEVKSELAKQAIVSELLLFLVNNSSVSPQQAQSLLGRIVVTEPLKRWHAMQTLHLYYDDVASVQASKAHYERSLLYSARARAAGQILFETGVGIVARAVPQAPVPELIHEPSNAVAFSFRAKSQYVDEAGNVGLPSKEFWVQSRNGESLRVAYTHLPETVAGWNLYLEDRNKRFRSVNPSMLGNGESFEISSMEGPIGSLLNDDGQLPEQYIRPNRLIRA